MDVNFFKAPDSYDYRRYSNDVGQGVVALHDGVGIAVESVRRTEIPFIPESWKQAINEVRMRRGEVRAAAKADRFRENWNKLWLMGAQQ